MTGAAKSSRTAEASTSKVRLHHRRAPRMGGSPMGASKPAAVAALAGTSHLARGRARSLSLPKGLKLGFHHHLLQLLKAYFRFPSQKLASFAGVAAEVIHFGGADQLGIDLHILLPVEPNAGKRHMQKFLHAVGFTGRDHKIVGLRL